MQLSDFVADALVQIAQGVLKANEQLAETGAIANPANVVLRSQDGHVYGRTSSETKIAERMVEVVKFDVAVFASEEKDKKGGAGIVVAAVTLGASRGQKSSEKTESRLKFSVPLLLPEVPPSKELSPQRARVGIIS